MSAGPCRKPLPFHSCQWWFHRYIFDLKTTFLKCCVPCLIVGNRDQLFKFLNQSISMACTAFKRPTKSLGMCGLFILGLGFYFMLLSNYVATTTNLLTSFLLSSCCQEKIQFKIMMPTLSHPQIVPLSVWPEKNCRMSIKVAQNWFHQKNDRFWHFYKKFLRIWEIWTN